MSLTFRCSKNWLGSCSTVTFSPEMLNPGPVLHSHWKSSINLDLRHMPLIDAGLNFTSCLFAGCLGTSYKKQLRTGNSSRSKCVRVNAPCHKKRGKGNSHSVLLSLHISITVRFRNCFSQLGQTSIAFFFFLVHGHT